MMSTLPDSLPPYSEMDVVIDNPASTPVNTPESTSPSNSQTPPSAQSVPTYRATPIQTETISTWKARYFCSLKNTFTKQEKNSKALLVLQDHCKNKTFPADIARYVQPFNVLPKCLLDSPSENFTNAKAECMSTFEQGKLTILNARIVEVQLLVNTFKLRLEDLCSTENVTADLLKAAPFLGSYPHEVEIITSQLLDDFTCYKNRGLKTTKTSPPPSQDGSQPENNTNALITELSERLKSFERRTVELEKLCIRHGLAVPDKRNTGCSSSSRSASPSRSINSHSKRKGAKHHAHHSSSPRNRNTRPTFTDTRSKNGSDRGRDSTSDSRGCHGHRERSPSYHRRPRSRSRGRNHRHRSRSAPHNSRGYQGKRNDTDTGKKTGY